MPEFVHLHTHTKFSLLDGACRIDELLDTAASLGMKSMAITDHGNMYGVVEFYKEAKKRGIKPILGCEAYTAPRSRFDMNGRRDAEPGHLVLLAENDAGWHNLIKIISAGFVDGFYYKPRIDMEILRMYSEGIICLSACLAGDIPRSLLDDNNEKAEEYIKQFIDIFGRENFFIELQDHNIPDQKRVNAKLIPLAEKYGLGMVVTNDIHYIKKDDASVQDVLLCIQTNKKVTDENRMKFASDEFYVKSPEEMASLFPDMPQLLENTVKIAERCNVELEFGKFHLPQYPLPEGTDSYEFLEKLCIDGIKKRYPENFEDLMPRMQYELETIYSMGYVDYFLIVWDFIKYAKDNNIMVGPGRGSAAGSIVSYVLKITDIDPIKYNLIFERFLNPARISMPDIDIDFCIERRGEVINYVNEKYGHENVAQIVTFGTLKAKQAVRDCARAMDIPYAYANKIAKLIPNDLKMTITKALKESRELAQLYESDEQIKSVIDVARALEGITRHASTHAAGVVICSRPVTDYVPLSRNGEIITTQFDMETVQDMGLLKMDFLGLRNLTIIRDALDMIKRDFGRELELDKIDYSAKPVYDMISSGFTDGVFQLESRGMRNFMIELKPENLEDIIAGISLFRPGPMDQIPVYVKNKNNPDRVTYKHPLLKPILDVTYGCMVYQEQVMEIVRQLGGYSLGRADLVRRAMSKKKFDVMEKERQYFIYGLTDDKGNIEIEGALRRGLDEQTANEIFDEMIDFANYAFNKSHAAAYAIVAYQTAYLKVFYPVQYMAALLTSVLSSTDKVYQYKTEANRLNIKLLPPDINKSSDGFTADGENIRFGLSAIKNVGHNVVSAIISERTANGNFTSFADFVSRMYSRELNKRTIESFIKTGVFDSLGINRRRLLNGYEAVLDGLADEKKSVMEGQISLFGDDTPKISSDEFPDAPEFSVKERLKMEKEMTGIYISGHPLDHYSDLLKRLSYVTTADILPSDSEEDSVSYETAVNDGDNVTMVGIVSDIVENRTKSGGIMAFIILEDLYSTIETVAFSRLYERTKPFLEKETAVLVRGRIDINETQTKLIAEDIMLLDTVNPQQETKSAEGTLFIKFKLGKYFLLDMIMDILVQYRGSNPVCIYNEETNRKFISGKEYYVANSPELFDKISEILGNSNVIFRSVQK